MGTFAISIVALGQGGDKGRVGGRGLIIAQSTSPWRVKGHFLCPTMRHPSAKLPKPLRSKFLISQYMCDKVKGNTHISLQVFCFHISKMICTQWTCI